MKMLLDYDVMLEILERLDSGENRFDDLKDNGDVVTLYLDGPEDNAEGKIKIYDFEKFVGDNTADAAIHLPI